MSRKLHTSINSLDGNSIFDIALKFEKLAIQEMNKQPEYLFQGEDLTNNKEGKFKMQFDKLFSLMQEFYVKIRGVNTRLNDNLNAELE